MKDQKTNWLSLSVIGYQLLASLLLFGWLGYFVDSKFFTSPLGLILGLVIGGVFSLYQIWQSHK